jgi:hypothetical protein
VLAIEQPGIHSIEPEYRLGSDFQEVKPVVISDTIFVVIAGMTNVMSQISLFVALKIDTGFTSIQFISLLYLQPDKRGAGQWEF